MYINRTIQETYRVGIDVKSADMHWQYIEKDNGQLQWFYLPKDFSINENESIPAWSLSALLGLMPTDDKKDEYYVDTESHSDYHTVSYRNCWDGCIHSEYSTESLINAAFEMICWLKENDKI